jgi:hypothetical protein
VWLLATLLLQVSSMSGHLLVLAAGQARQMGRMVNVCPDALLDDGLLDFTLLFGSPGKQVRTPECSSYLVVVSVSYALLNDDLQSSGLPLLFLHCTQTGAASSGVCSKKGCCDRCNVLLDFTLLFGSPGTAG